MSDEIRAARIHRHGTLDEVVVDRMEIPEPGPGEVRVRLRAAALNHLDLFVVGGLPGVDMPLPHVMGADGAGIVDAVGEGVDDRTAGEEVVLNPGLWCGRCEFCLGGEQSMCVRYRLLGEHVDGTFAEAITVPAANCHPRPSGLTWEESAAFPLVTLTAWRMLVTRAKVSPGQTVLIHGIGGGVSLASLQIAVAAGATAYVTSHSDDKLRRAAELGAAEGWNYDRVDVAEEVRQATGKRGVDLVVDNVGRATFEDSLKACRKGGTIVTCGVTSGAELPVDGRRLFWSHATIMGSTMGSERDFRAMLAAVRNGRVAPVIDEVLPLEEAADALRRMEAADQFGKIVLSIA